MQYIYDKSPKTRIWWQGYDNKIYVYVWIVSLFFIYVLLCFLVPLHVIIHSGSFLVLCFGKEKSSSIFRIYPHIPGFRFLKSCRLAKYYFQYTCIFRPYLSGVRTRYPTLVELTSQFCSAKFYTRVLNGIQKSKYPKTLVGYRLGTFIQFRGHIGISHSFLEIVASVLHRFPCSANRLSLT